MKKIFALTEYMYYVCKHYNNVLYGRIIIFRQRGTRAT